MRAWLVVCAWVVVGCKSGSRSGSGSGSGSGTQTYADAMKILCGQGVAPPPELAGAAAGAWLDGQIRDPKGRVLLASLADAPDPAARVREAAAEAGVAGCRPLGMLAPRFANGVDLAALSGEAGTVELDQDLPLIAASPSAVTVDGQDAVAITGGAIGAEAQAELGKKIEAAATAYAKGSGGIPFFAAAVAIDASLDTPVLTRIGLGLARAGARRFELVVRVDGALRAVPLWIADARPPAPPAGAPPPVGMLVVVYQDRVVVASTSGQEGTLGEPRLAVAIRPLASVAAPLQGALGQIVAQRWPGKGKAPEAAQEPLTVMTGDPVRVAVVAQIAAWVRARADGTSVFPDVALATGLEY